MNFDRYVPGEPRNAAGTALGEMLREEKPGQIHTDTMRLRISGGLAHLCTDTYFVAHEQGTAYARLWHGWARGRRDTVGNFGNFLTLEKVRGRGIGRQLLELWHEDLTRREDRPLALFCSAKEEVAGIYFPYGFQPALAGAKAGPLYLPVDRPDRDFGTFCQWYYQPADFLISRPADFGWRHEIDCLLHFALRRAGESFGLGDVVRLEQALLYYPERAQLYFTPEGRCVGWSVDGQTQLHPAYRTLPVEREDS